jgi:hypothetical protein
MIDKERLIKAWGIFQKSNPYEICEGREFRAIKEPEYCMGQMISDTIDLLKEKPEVVRCKDCKHYMTIHCTCDGCCISDDWFCADGERREENESKT